LTADNLSLLKIMMSIPEGIILVTGPTGSGKTTTLYSILNSLNTERVNIMTLEDPVEFPIPGLRQSAVNEAARLTFDTGIRSMLRQDPDIILVGEIRDRDTAEMALRAAMTGHQVYATLHTNSAPGAIPRLLDIGMRPEILAEPIIGIAAQRLARRLCPRCRQPYDPGDDERRIVGAASGEPLTLYRAAGCQACDHQGYKGRFALMELLRMDDELNDCVARRATLHELRQTAMRKGFQPLAVDGIRRIREGVTTIDEVSRLVDLTRWIVS
jgi:type IV pilus assembly protein PilB